MLTEEVQANGHTESEWIIEVEATHRADGLKYRICKVCDQRIDSQVVPCIGPMESEDLAVYVQERTVSMIINGSSVGSGFFIDENGTLVTCFHVIEDLFYSSEPSIEIVLSSGARYTLDYVVKFDPAYDLAVLKIDTKSMKTPYFAIADEESVVGAKAYSCGAALGLVVGNFTDGQISAVSHKYGLADSYISNAAISSGNSGGPLVNIYGEVIGVAVAKYTHGENLNVFLKISNLEKLRVSGNKNLKDFIQWHNFESRDAMIKFYFGEDGFTGWYTNSYIHTYHDEVGAKCLYSSDDGYGYNGYQNGYDSTLYYHTYRYDKNEYFKYTEYLKSEGYIYDETAGGDLGDEEYVDFYYNDIDDSYIMCCIYTYNGQRLIQLTMVIFE